MLDEQRAQPAAPAAVPAAGRGGPRWRALLEDRWQTRLREVTELSLAYHQATDVIPHGQDAGEGGPEAQQLLDRTVAARRQLADTEEALGRLAAVTAMASRYLPMSAGIRACVLAALGVGAAWLINLDPFGILAVATRDSAIGVTVTGLMIGGAAYFWQEILGFFAGLSRKLGDEAATLEKPEQLRRVA